MHTPVRGLAHAWLVWRIAVHRCDSLLLATLSPLTLAYTFCCIISNLRFIALTLGTSPSSQFYAAFEKIDFVTISPCIFSIVTDVLGRCRGTARLVVDAAVGTLVVAHIYVQFYHSPAYKLGEDLCQNLVVIIFFLANILSPRQNSPRPLGRSVFVNMLTAFVLYICLFFIEDEWDAILTMGGQPIVGTYDIGHWAVAIAFDPMCAGVKGPLGNKKNIR
jgi:hypothetical protein